MLDRIKGFFLILPNIGIKPTDSESDKLRMRFMNSMALLMSNGGILWGGISLYYGAYLQASIPLGYTLFTSINLTFFHFKKRFAIYRFTQVFMSLMLPFLFQASLGGIIDSGGMMLWSFLALVGSMSVQDIKLSIYWLIAFVIFVILSGFLDPDMARFSLELEKEVKVWFFVINIAFISTVIFSLTLYYISSRNVANNELRELTSTLEEKVDERTSELQYKNELVELKNKNITDSLNYARRIQSAILNKNEKACLKLNDHFILFKPKDIVSGDFYWFHCDPEEKKFIIAVVDCTGHGVPGAFMSLIGDSLLNQIVIDKRILDPGTILHEMDKGIEKSLKAEESNRRDGMDMAILVLEENRRTVHFAGAKIPMVYIDQKMAHVMKGSVHAIGGGKVKKEKSFTTQTTKLPENSMIYLFSDGFPDQLGGDYARTYLAKYFRTYLQKIAHLPCKEQKVKLLEEFNHWKGNLPQTDDTLVVGIRV